MFEGDQEANDLSLNARWRAASEATRQNPGTGTFPSEAPAAAPIAEENDPENAARIIAMVSSLYVT